MPDPEKLCPVHHESIGIPPEKSIIAIPLRGAVEVAPETERQPSTPEEKVEAFLESHGSFFGAVEDAWSGVKASHEAFKANLANFQQENSSGSRHAREDRRRNERAMRDFTPNVTFGTCKLQAAQVYPRFFKKPEDGKTVEDRNRAFATDIHEAYIEEARAIDADEALDDAPKFLRDFIVNMVKGQAVIKAANLYARFRQDVALEVVQDFLEDPDVVPAFVNRLHSLAAMNEQLRDYPGLLELLANHVEEKGKENMLQAAILRSAPEPETYSHEFMEHVGSTPAFLPKELSAAIGVMEIAANIVESEFSLTRQDFLQLFAGRVDTWPLELRNRLLSYAADKTNEQWNGLKSVLTGFVRTGRLPAEGNKRTITDPKHKKSTGPVPENAKTQPKTITATLANSKADHTDVLGNTEREPIKSFAVLVSRGDKAGMRFGLQTVSDMGNLFLDSNLLAYIETHKGDQTLLPLFEAALRHLTLHPKDAAHTTQLQGVTYQLEDKDWAVRKPRRFSPQHFPAVSKGPIATKTRILYDVFNHGGETVLVVYGAFLKADVERMSKLPPIR